jgi:hypothetical protein
VGVVLRKPTIREILTDFDITDPKHEMLAERVEKVLAIHHVSVNPQGQRFCVECMRIGWPCKVVRALDGEWPRSRSTSLRLERRAVASEAAVGRLRTALEELVAYQNGSPLPSYDEGWANAMRLADEALHGEGEK